MKKILPCLVFISAFFISKGQTDMNIVLGKINTINSKILGENKKVWVYVPNSASSDIYAKARYPVVYLLDGDAHFYSVVGMIHQLSSVNGNSICPEMIVVGILHNDRMRDLTPTHVDVDPMSNDSNMVRTSGGGEQFATYLEKELMPYIEAKYPTLPYRTLIGHSIGGLTVMNMLVNHKEMFNAYIAIDPSMWWDSKKLLSKVDNTINKQNYKGKSIFLAIANTMDDGMDTTKVIKETSLATEHIRSILTLNTLLQKSKPSGLEYFSKYYGSDTHGSVPLIATYDALHSIFKFYDFNLTMDDYMSFSSKTIAKVESHYKDVSKHFGFAFPVPETMANQLGYMALSQKKMDEAEYLFKLNVKNYPTSLNVYDSLGDFYADKGEKEKAIESYKKALTIKEREDTRNKLNALSK